MNLPLSTRRLTGEISNRRLTGATATLFVLALLGAPGLRAQENNPCAAAANPCAAKAMSPTAAEADDMDKYMSQMATTLDLSDEQVEKIKPIMMASHQKSQAIMAEYDGQKTEAAMEEMQALRKSTMMQLEEVLSEDQMKKLQSMMMMEKHRGMGMEKKDDTGTQSESGY